MFLPLLQFIRAGQCNAIVDPLTVVSDGMSDISIEGIVFKPLRFPIRYEYAILTPKHRPLSQLALRLKQGWTSEVMRALSEIGANPHLDENTEE